MEIKPDIDKARRHIAKAEHNLKAINRFKEIGFSDWSITAGFYCIYHCFLAMAFKFGYESKNQTCTIALIEWLKEEGKINIDSNFIDMLKHADIDGIQESKIIDMREEYTYGIEIFVEDNSKIENLTKTCKEIIDITKDIIFEK